MTTITASEFGKKLYNKKKQFYDQWVHGEDKAQYDVLKYMKLSEMKEISEEKLMSLDMLSSEAWNKLNKDPDVIRAKVAASKPRRSDEECVHLADGWLSFHLLWLEDNGLCFSEGFNPDKDPKKRKVEIYYNDNDDCYYYYRGNLENDFMARWCDILEND